MIELFVRVDHNDWERERRRRYGRSNVLTDVQRTSSVAFVIEIPLMVFLLSTRSPLLLPSVFHFTFLAWLPLAAH